MRAQAATMTPADWGLILVLSVVWGGSFFFYKVLVTALPPFTIVLGRVGIAALALHVVLVVRGIRLPRDGRTWGRFAMLGFLNNVVPFGLIVFGETRITSGMASILNATTPIFAVLVGHALADRAAGGGERLTRWRAAGVLAGFAGVLVLVGPDALSPFGHHDLPAEAACLAASLSYAVAGFYAKRLRGLAPLQVATGQVTASTIMLLPVVLVFERPWTLAMPDAGTWAALLALALLCTAFAYLLFFRILASAGATNVMLVTFLLPISALALGHVALGEPVGWSALGGMALIGLGLAAIDGRLPARLRAALPA